MKFPKGLRVRLAVAKSPVQLSLFGPEREPLGALGTVDMSALAERGLLMVAVYWDGGTASWVRADRLEPLLLN